MNRTVNQCPCCGNSLLRHARHGGVYWFCTSCRQEVPMLLNIPTPSKTMLSSPLAAIAPHP